MWKIISNTFSRFIRNRREALLLGVAVLFLSLYLFKVIGGGRPDASKLSKNSNLTSKDDASKDGATIWTCAMHPQIRLPAPGKCPICAMDLIPLTGHAHELTDSQIVLSEAAQQTARVRTVPVVRRMAHKEIRLPGRVETISGKESHVLSPTTGTVSRVTVTSAGTLVRPGDPLVEIKESTGTLRQVLASSTGVVLARGVREGAAVDAGQELYVLADLSSVWITFDASESDIPWIKTGAATTVRFDALPGQEWQLPVSTIGGTLSADTRTAPVRVILNNPSGALLPGMLATGIFDIQVGPDTALLIPATSPLLTGKRAVVYVETTRMESGETIYESREVILGARAGDDYVVKQGLHEGEHVVAEGAYKIDAAMQIQAKRSMMDRAAGMPSEGTAPSRAVFDKVLSAYDRWVAALVKEDLSGAGRAMNELNSSFGNAGDAGPLADMRSALARAGGKDDLSSLPLMRKTLQPVSLAISKAIRSLPESSGDLHLFFCPMMDGGAHWIASGSAVRNPYFGQAMLTCGEDLGPVAIATPKISAAPTQSQPSGHNH